MGKKGTKRKTRWRALPLGEDDAGSGNEEEFLDEDRSTISSLAGQTTNIKVHSPVFRTSGRPYRPHRRFPYDKFMNKEPLIKLESKTFDEEEYTKITTPRQDVLVKKGYFGRKRESSVDETVISVGEADGEESLMDQYIITTGFLDERGHYYVNGSSYELYDPYSNTVTVVVGPPPYMNGVNQPVLAAVSCQPVPLTPVEWYPPGEDWPTHGSAWTPSYSLNENTPNGDVSPSFTGHDPRLHMLSANAESGHAFNENYFPVIEGGFTQELNFGGLRPKDNENTNEWQEWQDKSNEQISQSSPADEKGEVDSPSEMVAGGVEEKNVAGNSDSLKKNGVVDVDDLQVNVCLEKRDDNKEQKEIMSPLRKVEKQNHSTQTNISNPALPTAISSSVKVKESHSTQTIPEESFTLGDSKQSKNLRMPAQVEQRPKFIPNKVETMSAIREANSKTIYQRKMNEVSLKQQRENKESSLSLKTSYARKLLNGLDNSVIKNNDSAKLPNTDGSQTFLAHTAETSRSATKYNLTDKRLTTNKFTSSEGKRNLSWNGVIKNGYEKQRHGKGPPQRKTNIRSESNKEKKHEVEVVETQKETSLEEAAVVEGTITANSRCHSEKSSTLSELSSPTELSSGQNTPPEKLIVSMMEENFVEDLGRSVGKTMQENLIKANEEAVKEEEGEKMKSNAKSKKKKEKGSNIEEPTSRAKRQKKRRKGTEDKTERLPKSDDSSDDNLFIHLYGKTQDFLSKAWENLNVENIEPIPDFKTILTTENNEILATLGIVDKWNVPKLQLASDLAYPAFERPKLKFEDFFASAALKDLQNEVFTKTNITNMRSTKPEEFFASIVENPERDRAKKENGKSNKKGARFQDEGLQKKFKSGKGGTKRSEELDLKIKEEQQPEREIKLGIVDAVNSWLREQGDPEKVLSPDVLKELPKELNDDQKNELGNPIHASLAEVKTEVDEACIRVANTSKDDGYLGTETETKKEEEYTRLYRSSSWDAKLSDSQIKKHFQFLMEASSWDKKKLKDANIRKHLKFIADSANFLYREVMGDVQNGYEVAREELCDPKQTVSKYYILSPGSLESGKTIDCEGEAFDALDFRFAGRSGNPSVTDSGVHSDSESNEELSPSSESKFSAHKDVTCKMQ